MITSLVAFGLIHFWGLKGELAAGFMLLSFCPGGVTSNVLSRLARGDVALSVSLTALVSLLSIVTVPMLVALSVGYFMGGDAPVVSVTSLALAMVLITAVPVALGMGLRAALPGLVTRSEAAVLRLATVLFALIIVAAVASNWSVLLEWLALLGPAAISLVVVMLVLGLLVTRMAGLSLQERKTVAIEAGIQNGTLGITLAPIIVGSTAALPAMALPSAMYGVAMYAVTLPALIWLRRL